MRSLQLGPKKSVGCVPVTERECQGRRCVTHDLAHEALSSLGYKITSLNSTIISTHGT